MRQKSSEKACAINAIDFRSDVSTMVRSPNIEKPFEYIYETKTYIFLLLEILKHNYPEYANLAFLIKYQLPELTKNNWYLIAD